MSDQTAPWLRPLGLKESEFSQTPPGEDAALWGLKNQVIPELKFSQWVSETYKIPTIDPNFFNLAIDFSLLEKFANLYEWNEHCFPIYLWEDTLFVACLTPEPLPFDKQKYCLVTAPYSAMKAAWIRHDTGANKTVHVPAAAEEIEPPEPSIPIETATRDTPPPEPVIESLGDLDFSSLDGMGSSPQPKEASQDEQELTSTKVDNSPLNNLTTATQTAQKKTEDKAVPPENLPFPELDFGNISVEDISLEGEASPLQAPPPSPFPQPKAQEEQPPLAPPQIEPPLDEDSQVEDSQAENSLSKDPGAEHSQDEDFDDDYTPVPFISQKDKELFKHTHVGMSEIQKPKGPIENTLTECGGKPVNHAAMENLVTESEMNRCLELKTCHTKKDIISHIFLHLKRDYRKLMWVEGREDGFYYPTYIFGSWAMTKEAWNTPVNLLKPNIFRIASLSNLPFHGEVSKNEINTQYFLSWVAGKTPDVVTIYPVSNDDQLKGFVVAFSINEEFDQVGSLNKLQNLVNLCSKYLLQSKFKTSA